MKIERDQSKESVQREIKENEGHFYGERKKRRIWEIINL